jgi:sterol desaturase/sphingolipid hydroxylase (fatty acid hydroxylase superfamily)
VTQALNSGTTQLETLVWMAAAMFALLLGRYLLVVGPLYLVYWKLLRKRLQHKRIQRVFPPRRRLLGELGWSLSTFAVFTAVGVTLFLCNQMGWTRLYRDLDERGWGYWALSIVLMMLVHDAYFYWTHRFMHLERVFRYFHRVHHLSFNPSPWAAFSFHPLEAVVEASIIYVIAFSIPFHPSALFVFLLFMTVMNALGHLGYELYPRGFTRHWLGRWFNTSVHHNMHHHLVRCNYGLYFNWWDRLMGTNHATYHQRFDAVAGRAPVRPAGRDQPAVPAAAAPGADALSEHAEGAGTTRQTVP